MCSIAYVTSAMVTPLTIPWEVVCVVVATWVMAKTMGIVMAALIDGSIAISNFNIIAGGTILRRTSWPGAIL